MGPAQVGGSWPDVPAWVLGREKALGGSACPSCQLPWGSLVSSDHPGTVKKAVLSSGPRSEVFEIQSHWMEMKSPMEGDFLTYSAGHRGLNELPAVKQSSGPGILLLAPDFSITAPFPSLFVTMKVRGIRDRLVPQHRASRRAQS